MTEESLKKRAVELADWAIESREWGVEVIFAFLRLVARGELTKEDMDWWEAEARRRGR